MHSLCVWGKNRVQQALTSMQFENGDGQHTPHPVAGADVNSVIGSILSRLDEMSLADSDPEAPSSSVPTGTQGDMEVEGWRGEEESFVCPHCGFIISSERKEAHLRHWCDAKLP